MIFREKHLRRNYIDATKFRFSVLILLFVLLWIDYGLNFIFVPGMYCMSVSFFFHIQDCKCCITPQACVFYFQSKKQGAAGTCSAFTLEGFNQTQEQGTCVLWGGMLCCIAWLGMAYDMLMNWTHPGARTFSVLSHFTHTLTYPLSYTHIRREADASKSRHWSAVLLLTVSLACIKARWGHIPALWPQGSALFFPNTQT